MSVEAFRAQFETTEYNGIGVVRHKTSGYYNASKVCRDNKKLFKDWFRNKRTQELLDKRAKQLHLEIEESSGENSTAPKCLIFEVKNIENTVANLCGYYIHPKLMNEICMWADIDYALKVDEIMDLINEKSRVSLEETIEKLRSEIADLTTPIDQRAAPPTIYALPIGEKYFQLKASSSILGPKVPTLKKESFVGAVDVCKIVKKDLKNKGLSFQKKAYGKKFLSSRDRLDEIFEQIRKVKNREFSEQSDKLEKTIAKWKAMKQTPQIIAKIFELEYIQSNKELTAWEHVPANLLNSINEVSKDTGIDAVRIENETIKEIVQIKFHSSSRCLQRAEISTFLEKALQERYLNTKKRLLLHNCKVGPKIRKVIEAHGVEIEEI